MAKDNNNSDGKWATPLILTLVYILILIVVIYISKQSNKKSNDFNRRIFIIFLFFTIFYFLFWLCSGRCYYETFENYQISNEASGKETIEKENKYGRTEDDLKCEKDTVYDPESLYTAEISFWKTSDLEKIGYSFDYKDVELGGKATLKVPELKSYPYVIKVDEIKTKIEPVQKLQFSWNQDSGKECFAWWRSVADSDERRLNVASEFSIRHNSDGSYSLTFTQNDGECCDEFKGSGSIKEIKSDILTVDDTTCQTGDCLWLSLSKVSLPLGKIKHHGISEKDMGSRSGKVSLCTL